MSTRTFMAAAAAVALLGYLFFRIVDLETRVASLTQQLGSPTAADAPVANTDTTDKTPSAPSPPLGYQQRLTALEKDVASLKAAQQRVQTASGTGRAQDDKDILSVVERENSRIRDVQLEWNKARWLENRDAQLVAFARQYGLTSDQTSGLQKALQQEVDRMVELMKRPGLMDDPDQAAADWQAMLDATDKSAQEVLSPSQVGPWNQARLFERRVFFPWLPSNLNK
jgi:hypothetical protein